MILPDQPERSTLGRHNHIGRLAKVLSEVLVTEVLPQSMKAGMPKDDARAIASALAAIVIIIGNGGIAPSLAKAKQEVVDGSPNAAPYLSALERIRDFPVPSSMDDDAEPKA